MSLTTLFLELAKPNKNGFSREVHVSEFKGEYERLKLGNGGSWCRDDGPLGKIYNIKRGKIPGKSNKIAYVQLMGFKKQPQGKPIPGWVRDALKGRRCVVLYTIEVEIDHKDGRRDDPRLTDPNLVTLDDFQPLSKAANNAKRQHCKTCRDTNYRFDAKELGFTVSHTNGDGVYHGSCVGCYWYDPVAFRKYMDKPVEEEVSASPEE